MVMLYIIGMSDNELFTYRAFSLTNLARTLSREVQRSGQTAILARADCLNRPLETEHRAPYRHRKKKI